MADYGKEPEYGEKGKLARGMAATGISASANPTNLFETMPALPGSFQKLTGEPMPIAEKPGMPGAPGISAPGIPAVTPGAPPDIMGRDTSVLMDAEDTADFWGKVAASPMASREARRMARRATQYFQKLKKRLGVNEPGNINKSDIKTP